MRFASVTNASGVGMLIRNIAAGYDTPVGYSIVSAGILRNRYKGETYVVRVPITKDRIRQ